MVHKHSRRDHSPKLGKRGPDGGDEGVHVVYVTAPATFEGDIGGYVTGDNDAKTEVPTAGVGPAVQATKTADAEKPEETGDENTENDKDTDHASTKEQDTESTTQTADEKPPKTQQTATHSNDAAATLTNDQHSHHTTLATATADVTKGNTHASATNSDLNQLVAATSSSTSGSSDSLSKTSGDSGSGDMSSGAKAGVAIGVVLGAALIAVVVFFLVRRKKQNKNMRDDEDEKMFGNLGPLPEPQSPPQPGARTPEEPPQLDVRPVTQFAPFGVGNSNAPTATGAAEVGAAAAAKRTTAQSPVSSHKDPFGDPVNPFENNRTEPASRSVSPPEASGAGATQNGPATQGAAAAVATGAIGGAAALKAKPSEKDLPTSPAQPLQDPADRGLPRPHTPDTASIASYNAFAASPVVAPAGVPGPAAGPPPGSPGPQNVHRVQMDFTPSMDDELPLRSGQLVRLAHEYDDGWALCVRLDRPQQGVAPRSCLSARPVKPRPRPPPGTPGSRGPPPMGMNGRPPPGPSSRFYPAPDGPPSSPAHPKFGGSPALPHQPMSAAQYPRAPRSAPGIRQVSPRSMSPGPYGAPGASRPQKPVPYRSNSAGRPAVPVVAETGSTVPSIPQPSAAEAHNVF